MFEMSHIIAPAGAAKITALHNTIKVRSISEVYIVCKNLGGLYGGSSNVKKDDSPFKSVLDNSHEVKKVKAIPKTAIPITANIETVPAHFEDTKAPTKIVAINICIGHLPLQREKLLVIIAMSFSRGLLIILVAITPAALHPKPILIVRDCLP